MEQTNICEIDPPEIRERLQRIQRQQALIEDLATRLKTAKLECDRLETELSAYRASIAPVRKCPEEILLMIFETFSRRTPELLAGLAQVCKRWHGIVVNAPQLWTHIEIKIKPTWNQKEGARRDQARIRTCLERSASLPLHISVDLRDMLDEDSRMSECIEELAVGCDNDICLWLRGYVPSLDDDTDVHMRYFCEEYGTDSVLGTISELVGYDGMHMDRWKSLHILLPRSGQDVSAIFPLFCGSTPQLTELLISGEEPPQSYLTFTTDGPAIFPDLSSLESLILDAGTVLNLDFLPLTCPSVKRLEMETLVPNSLQLSRFKNLEYLDILFHEVSTNADSASEVIHLPVLRDLTLHVYESTRVEWHVPILQRLTIIGLLDGKSKAAPTVRALHVFWRLGQPNYTTKIEPSLLRTLHVMISEYRDMERLSIRTLLKPIWDKYVEGLSEEMYVALPTVDFD